MMIEREDKEKVKITGLCQVYILRNIQRAGLLPEFTKNYMFHAVNSWGMSIGQAGDALPLLSLQIINPNLQKYNLLQYEGKIVDSQELYDRYILNNDVPCEKTCIDYYKKMGTGDVKFDKKQTLCTMCPYSKKYLNIQRSNEFSVLKFAWQSLENANKIKELFKDKNGQLYSVDNLAKYVQSTTPFIISDTNLVLKIMFNALNGILGEKLDIDNFHSFVKTSLNLEFRQYETDKSMPSALKKQKNWVEQAINSIINNIKNAHEVTYKEIEGWIDEYLLILRKRANAKNIPVNKVEKEKIKKKKNNDENMSIFDIADNQDSIPEKVNYDELYESEALNHLLKVEQEAKENSKQVKDNKQTIKEEPKTFKERRGTGKAKENSKKQRKLKENGEVDWEYIAMHDERTDLLNNRAYDDALASADAYITGIFFDANNLKFINDTYSHEAGDRLIYEVANAIKKVFGNDKGYRIGGDEFVVIITEAVVEEELIKKLKEVEDIVGSKSRTNELPFSVSYGYCIGDGTLEAYNIIKEADKRMYEYKKAYKKAHPEYDIRGEYKKAVQDEVNNNSKKSALSNIVSGEESPIEVLPVEEYSDKDILEDELPFPLDDNTYNDIEQNSEQNAEKCEITSDIDSNSQDNNYEIKKDIESSNQEENVANLTINEGFESQNSSVFKDTAIEKNTKKQIKANNKEFAFENSINNINNHIEQEEKYPCFETNVKANRTIINQDITKYKNLYWDDEEKETSSKIGKETIYSEEALYVDVSDKINIPEDQYKPLHLRDYEIPYLIDVGNDLVILSEIENMASNTKLLPCECIEDKFGSRKLIIYNEKKRNFYLIDPDKKGKNQLVIMSYLLKNDSIRKVCFNQYTLSAFCSDYGYGLSNVFSILTANITLSMYSSLYSMPELYGFLNEYNKDSEKYEAKFAPSINEKEFLDKIYVKKQKVVKSTPNSPYFENVANMDKKNYIKGLFSLNEKQNKINIDTSDALSITQAKNNINLIQLIYNAEVDEIKKIKKVDKAYYEPDKTIIESLRQQDYYGGFCIYDLKKCYSSIYSFYNSFNEIDGKSLFGALMMYKEIYKRLIKIQTGYFWDIYLINSLNSEIYGRLGSIYGLNGENLNTICIKNNKNIRYINLDREYKDCSMIKLTLSNAYRTDCKLCLLYLYNLIEKLPIRLIKIAEEKETAALTFVCQDNLIENTMDLLIKKVTEYTSKITDRDMHIGCRYGKNIERI